RRASRPTARRVTLDHWQQSYWRNCAHIAGSASQPRGRSSRAAPMRGALCTPCKHGEWTMRRGKGATLPDMRRRLLRPRMPLLRYMALLALTLCGLVTLRASVERSRIDTSTPSHSPLPARIVARAGDVQQLCTVISPVEFARVTGTRATAVEGGARGDTLTGLQEVYCIYLDTSDPTQFFGRGTINFELAADAPSAARTFKAVKQSFTG